MNSTLFRKNSLEYVLSPEKLNEYIKVTSPSSWLIVTAVAVLIISLFSWSIVGSVPVKVSLDAIYNNEELISFYPEEDISKIKIGMKIIVNNQLEGSIENVSKYPYSVEQIKEFTGSPYEAKLLTSSQWCHKITMKIDEPIVYGEIYSVDIITNEIHPIEFMFN